MSVNLSRGFHAFNYTRNGNSERPQKHIDMSSHVLWIFRAAPCSRISNLTASEAFVPICIDKWQTSSLKNLWVLKIGLRCLSILVGDSASGKFQDFSIIYWNVNHCMIVIKLPATHILSPRLETPNLFPTTSFDLPATMDPTGERSVSLVSQRLVKSLDPINTVTGYPRRCSFVFDDHLVPPSPLNHSRSLEQSVLIHDKS